MDRDENDTPGELRGGPDDLPSRMGSLHGQIWIASDADEDWAETTRLMEEGPVLPDEPTTA